MKKYIISTLLVLSMPIMAQNGEVTPNDNGLENDKQLFMANPNEILQIRDAHNKTQQAKFRSIIDPAVQSSFTEITLAPEEAIQEVNLIPRAPTTISFVDATGTPWPVVDSRIYDSDLFGLEKVNNSFLNSLWLHGILPAGTSFLAVFLKDLPDPIMIKVNIGDTQYHAFKTFKIMRIGPKAIISEETLGVVSQLGMPTDADLNNALFAVTPVNAKLIKSNNPNITLWRKGNEILARTNLSIFSPQAVHMTMGTNGYKAYRLPNTSRIYASNELGQVIKIAVE